jgi:hypothetical protein
VQRVHADPVRAHERLQQSARLEHDVVRRSVLHVQRVFLVFPMIIEARDFVHALMERSAHRHVHLLKSTADAEHRHARRHRARDQ